MANIMKPITLFVFTTVLLASTPIAHAQTPEEMLQLINQARSSERQCGGRRQTAAPPLQLDAALQRAAQKHADDMAQKRYFNHRSRNGRSPFQRIQAEGYRFQTAGENIALGHARAEEAIRSWLRSAGHCRNIMNRHFTHTGIARNGRYWVQVFATPQ